LDPRPAQEGKGWSSARIQRPASAARHPTTGRPCGLGGRTAPARGPASCPARGGQQVFPDGQGGEHLPSLRNQTRPARAIRWGGAPVRPVPSMLTLPARDGRRPWGSSSSCPCRCGPARLPPASRSDRNMDVVRHHRLAIAGLGPFDDQHVPFPGQSAHTRRSAYTRSGGPVAMIWP
jgi:hypothetical protein